MHSIDNPFSIRVPFAAIAARVAAIVLMFHGSSIAQEPHTYTLEDINDTEFSSYPPPPPVHTVTHEHDIIEPVHDETVTVTSTNLRNVSISMENLGPGLIRAPHLLGPQGWDFRSLEAIAAKVTEEPGLSQTEKFIRVHEWKGLHVTTILGGSLFPYTDNFFSGNPLRVLNQYGHAMCSQSTSTINGLLRVVPPAGSMYGRKVRLNQHRTGEAFWEGQWHAFDTTPGTGIVQWIYFDSDNSTIAPTWKYLINNPQLVSKTKALTGSTIAKYLVNATGETFQQKFAYPSWNFTFDLRPNESITMYFNMRGRLDKTSARQDNDDYYRCYSDYASAVFRYRPDFQNDVYKSYVIEERNITRTSNGLVAADSGQKSAIIFEIKSTWCFAGAEIAAAFKTGGRVYAGVNTDPFDTKYSPGVFWQELSPLQAEYPAASIEGKMAYWVKLEFEGPGSGLNSVDIASEVQMSPWSMPGLEYGRNPIHFEASDMGGSKLHVAYRYDDRAEFDHYEPATSARGRHLPIRVGGVLQQGAKVGIDDYRKGRFWKRITEDPFGEVAARVDIYEVSGEGSGRLVRTLVNSNLRYGLYQFYWDGKDDGGNDLPVGMYSYKLSINGKVIHGERLYLYASIWPVPMEIMNQGAIEVIADDATSGRKLTGDWSSSDAPEPYGAGSRYAKITSTGAAPTFLFEAPLEPGEYEVFEWHTIWKTRSQRAHLVVEHEGGAADVFVDQSINGGQWNRIGVFRFGSVGRVTLLAEDPRKTINADALRFVRGLGSAN